jgi:flagellar assembly protein FliH
MTTNRHQAVGAYQRWAPPSFDAPEPASPPTPVEEAERPLEPELPAIVEEAPAPEAPILPPEISPDIHLPTADDIERIHDEARKEGYAAGYEEGTARGRIEAMQFHSLVEGLEDSMNRLDGEVADEILALATELARQMVRQTLNERPEAVVDLIREALLQLPQTHALIHLNPEDVEMAKEYLGEQLAHAGHRLVEDAAITRGGVRIDASGSQIDATVQTRWRRIMDNLGRNISWDGDGS